MTRTAVPVAFIVIGVLFMIGVSLLSECASDPRTVTPSSTATPPWPTATVGAPSTMEDLHVWRLCTSSIGADAEIEPAQIAIVFNLNFNKLTSPSARRVVTLVHRGVADPHNLEIVAALDAECRDWNRRGGRD